MKSITVYSKDNCPACQTVIAYLKTQQIPHTVLKLGEAFDIEYIKQTFPDAKQFPIVVTNENSVVNEYTGGAALTGVKQFLTE